MKLKPISYYKKNKKFFNEKYNEEWKKISGRPYVGCASYLFQNFLDEWKSTKEGKPTVDDFAEYYFSHANPIKSDEICRNDLENYGRSEEELWLLAKYYQKICNNYEIPLERFFDDIICHTIVETFTGQIWEKTLIFEYKKLGFTVKQTNGTWDAKYGVDIIVKNRGRIIDYVQCKPISTFLGNSERQKSLIEDRKNFYNKEKLKKEECIRCGFPYLPTKFVLYDESKNSWCSLPGRRGLYLEELADTNGMALHKSSDFVCIS